MLVEELYAFNPWWEEDFKPELIEREKYLSLLVSSLKTKDIVIITGLRRVGKTAIIKLFIKKLLAKIPPQYILYASCDSIPLENYSIHEIIETYRKEHRIKRNKKIYVFLDEIGFREKWAQELKNLYDRENIKFFISASSASMLKDKKGFLTGRTKTIRIFPLDFHEYLKFKKIDIKKSENYLKESYFEDYMKEGGIPEYVLRKDPAYLNELVESIIYKDIIYYHGIKNSGIVKDFFRLLMERVARRISLNKSAKILKVSADTIRRYFNYFKESFLIYEVERCGKLSERILSPKKIYAADVGIRNMITGFSGKGAIFENLFFFKIMSKQPCYIYEDGIEIDFLTKDKILFEVKYNEKMNEKQKTLFDKIRAKEKKLISNINDYFFYE